MPQDKELDILNLITTDINKKRGGGLYMVIIYLLNTININIIHCHISSGTFFNIIHDNIKSLKRI